MALKRQTRLDKRERVPFHYVDKGTMATIGRSRAVAVAGRLQMTGLLAWLAWLVVHIWYLIGFRSRLVVVMTWAWSYFTYRRGARLITKHGWEPHTSASSLPLPARQQQETRHDKHLRAGDARR